LAVPELVFEIWEDEFGHGMYRVDPQSDKLRASATARSILLHSFTATSSFDAFRQNSEWFGYAHWEPPDGLEDHDFTEQEAEEQREYMSRRSL
jgi:hypothetical protein